MSLFNVLNRHRESHAGTAVNIGCDLHAVRSDNFGYHLVGFFNLLQVGLMGQRQQGHGIGTRRLVVGHVTTPRHVVLRSWGLINPLNIGILRSTLSLKRPTSSPNYSFFNVQRLFNVNGRRRRSLVAMMTTPSRSHSGTTTTDSFVVNAGIMFPRRVASSRGHLVSFQVLGVRVLGQCRVVTTPLVGPNLRLTSRVLSQCLHLITMIVQLIRPRY